jgi:hypothetical protein
MAIGLQLLKLVAKIGLDLLIDPTRTDEAVELFVKWWSGSDAESRGAELAEAKKAVSDSPHLRKIVKEAVAAKEEGATPEQITRITSLLSSGFKALPNQLGVDQSAETFLQHVFPPWKNEWALLTPATRRPRPGTNAAILFDCLDETPSLYRQLWERAGFDKDPSLRTPLRKWAKAGWVNRVVGPNGITEKWSRRVAKAGQGKKGSSSRY